MLGVRIDPSSSGVFAIAPTPFRPGGAVDEASVDRMVDFYAEAGCSGITALGIMGEANKLEAGEALHVAGRVIRRGANLPVVIGVSAPGFAAMQSLALAVMDAGAAGVMIAPPPSLRTDDQIVTYFGQAAEAIGPGVPWVLQDYPLTLGVQMTPGVIRRIVADNPGCVMLKHEDWPGLEKITALRAFQAEGAMGPLSILTGNGALFLDFEMGRGADGAMTGYAFPDFLVALVALCRRGRRDEAHDLFDAHLPLIRYEQQQGVGLAVRKYVMARRGIIASDTQRRPFTGLSDRGRAEIDFLLARLARRDPRAA